MNNDFQSILDFIHEIEKLKLVERRIRVKEHGRYENSAEHSWHIALLALSLVPYAETQVDGLKVVTMLLLHDIVEIDTGDKFAYHESHDDFENELAAAKRIFALLPEAQHKAFLALWEEFEAAETAEAKFAKGIDRLMPVLQNLNNQCQSWIEHGISISQILEKNAGVKHICPELWNMVSERVRHQGGLAGLKE